MTTDHNDPTDDINDTDLQQLFAGVIPAAGFEDRLVNTVRQHQRVRLVIPLPVKKAAVAAAAVLAVGSIGYFGTRVITGKSMLVEVASSPKRASSQHQLGTPLLIAGDQQTNSLYVGRDSWQNNPFSGEQHDNIYARKSLVGNNTVNAPSDEVDSLLLPTDGVNKMREAQKGGRVSLSGLAVSGGHSDAPAAPPAAPDNRIGAAGGDGRGRFYSPTQNPHYDVFFNNGATKGPNANIIDNDGDPGFRSSVAAGEKTGNIPNPNYFDTKAPQSPGTEKKDLGIVDHLIQDTGKSLDTTRHDVNLGRGAIVLAVPAAKLTSLSAIDPPVDELDKDREEKKRGLTPLSPASQPVDDRKIIRTGSMEFEVDRFDTAQMQISKIVGELGGFVGATDSQKLPNGKVRGSISVRVAPERLDVLVLSLRALGDLKSQQITAADITKEYTDLQSELAADRAMQDRLLELINGGKGSIKDLLAAENELGTWRGKIEKAQGMIRYYNGQVALSTLSIVLSERDIQTPATAVETETADVGIEADDVEKARASALKAIDDAKGRVVEAELKRYDAGQLAARLVADVPPESAGAVIDQLKLLGKVARLEIHRQQTNRDGTNAVTGDTPLHTERKPTRLLISIYNLANVAPRRTTHVSLAAADVEAAYTALVSATKSSGGRVVTSNLDRGDPVKATGSLTLEFPPEKFESAMTALHAQGDVLKLTLTENPDTQNSTEAKQGLTVQLVSLAAVPPRESVQQTLAAGDVPTAYQAVLIAVNAAHARVLSAQLNEQDRQNISADLQLEVPRLAGMDFDKALAAAGGTISRTSSRAGEAEGTVDSKVQLHLSIISADHLAPRETTKLQVEVTDVDKSAGDIQAAALSAGGRVLEATITKDHGNAQARIVLDLPLEKSGDVLQQVRGQGTVRGIDSSRDPQAPAGAMAHGKLFVELDTPDAIVADQTGPWASVREGLSTSVAGLLWSLKWVIIGLCLIGPWAGIGWVGWKIWKRKTV